MKSIKLYKLTMKGFSRDLLRKEVYVVGDDLTTIVDFVEGFFRRNEWGFKQEQKGEAIEVVAEEYVIPTVWPILFCLGAGTK